MGTCNTDWSAPSLEGLCPEPILCWITFSGYDHILMYFLVCEGALIMSGMGGCLIDIMT